MSDEIRDDEIEDVEEEKELDENGMPRIAEEEGEDDEEEAM